VRRLVLVRHAKSSRTEPGRPDHDRPLTPRGAAAAARIGAWLRARGHRPDRALVSTAVRAQQTWTGLAGPLDDPPMTAVRALYHATPATMFGLVRDAGPAGCLLLVGHQPGIGVLVQDLLRSPAPAVDPRRYPTAATSVIEFDVADWSEIAWRTGRLADHVRPRDLDPRDLA
jgi:phosphohistidine phosphatase